MKPTRGNPIILYTQKGSLVLSRGILTSCQKSNLKDSLRNLNSGCQTSRIRPNDYSLKNKPHLKACNMLDPQIRIKRDYSPIYQRSMTQTELFEKGLKKVDNNRNLLSGIKMTDRIQQNKAISSQSVPTAKGIRRKNPNNQKNHIFDLDNGSLQGLPESITSRSMHKRNPNQQSQFKQPKKQKNQIRDKNIQTTLTADYVLRALSNHVANVPKEVHLKFNKKQNIHNKQNLNSEISPCFKDQLIRQHKRHFSNLTAKANKENIETRQNGICLKQDCENPKIDFAHDFYKKQSRMANNLKQQKPKAIRKTDKLAGKPSENFYFKTQYQQKPVINKFSELRKRFL